MRARIDILAAHPLASKPVFVQVKAKDQLGKIKKWLPDDDDEKLKPAGYFYAFVNLNNKTLSSPGIYIVPAKTVARAIKEDHQQFLAKGGRSNKMWHFFITGADEKAYLHNWKILK